MKSFVILSCIIVVASASHYNWLNHLRRYSSPLAFAQRITPTNRVAQGVVPSQAFTPDPHLGLESLSNVIPSKISADLELSNLINLARLGQASLNNATALVNTLKKYMPASWQRKDVQYPAYPVAPSIKSVTVPSTTSITVPSTTAPSTTSTTVPSISEYPSIFYPNKPIPSEIDNEFQTESLVSLIPFGMSSLSKASTSLKHLMNSLPAALSNMDSSIKHDIAKVNWVISNTCHKVMEEANKPEAFSYYSPEGMRETCNYVNKVAGNVLLALDDPSFTQYYVDKVTGAINAIQEISDVYSSV